MPYPGFYNKDGNQEVECEIIRMASQNSRIIIDGEEELVSSELVTRRGDATIANRNDPERIIPKTALETFYRKLRCLTGTPNDKFEAIKKLLHGRHGAVDAAFLSQLFYRSVAHANLYNNVTETFSPDRAEAQEVIDDNKFARKLVSLMGSDQPVSVEGDSISLVDFEIYPFRTTYSCTESGEPATRSGSGGMDMLLAVKSKDGVVIPAVGEIKASTETVGPTFALIQALMYASQLMTKNQFKRLREHYNVHFKGIDTGKPMMDLIILLQSEPQENTDDLDFALDLAGELANTLNSNIRQIRFFHCEIADNAVDFQIINNE